MWPLHVRRGPASGKSEQSFYNEKQVSGILDWNVAVYCANEGLRLRECLNSVVAGLSDQRAVITVILNGSRDGSRDIARKAARSNSSIEVFEISAADKSNAINQFHYLLRSPARAYAAVDGYVSVSADTFYMMKQKLEANPRAAILAGVAANGRTETRSIRETIAVGGKLHGQLYGIRPDFLDRMVTRGIKIPVGLYRGDGLLGSMAAHNLDPLTEPWDNTRLPGVEGATYEIQSLSPFKPAHLRRQLRRMVRQMRGTIESAAIKSIIYKSGYEGLPNDADAMIRDYLATHGAPPASPIARIFLKMAIQHAASAVPFKPEVLVPHRVALN